MYVLTYLSSHFTNKYNASDFDFHWDYIINIRAVMIK